MPIMNPDIVTAIGFNDFVHICKNGERLCDKLLQHIAFCTPYVIIVCIRKNKNNLANAAMDLGCNTFSGVNKSNSSMIKPGIFAGMLLALQCRFVVSLFPILVKWRFLIYQL